MFPCPPSSHPSMSLASPMSFTSLSLFSNCFNAGFEPTGPRASLSFCVFFLSLLFSFRSPSPSQAIIGAPSALLRPTRQNYSHRSIPVLSSSLGRKDDVALSFLSVRDATRENSSGKEEKQIIAVIRLSLGVSTFGQNCSPYAHHSPALQ
jgi:hypothetical protein